MYCKNCGKEIDNNAAVCIHCGVATDNRPAQGAGGDYAHHELPKCRKCGYIGEFKTEKMFRTKDWVIGIGTLFLGFGLIYLIIIAIIRSDKSSREKICPHCGGVDTATDVY